MSRRSHFFAEITQKRIRRSASRSVKSLEEGIDDYLEHDNRDPKPFVWTATAELIFKKVEKVCQRTSNSGHWGDERRNRFEPSRPWGRTV